MKVEIFYVLVLMSLALVACSDDAESVDVGKPDPTELRLHTCLSYIQEAGFRMDTSFCQGLIAKLDTTSYESQDNYIPSLDVSWESTPYYFDGITKSTFLLDHASFKFYLSPELASSWSYFNTTKNHLQETYLDRLNPSIQAYLARTEAYEISPVVGSSSHSILNDFLSERFRDQIIPKAAFTELLDKMHGNLHKVEVETVEELLLIYEAEALKGIATGEKHSTINHLDDHLVISFSWQINRILEDFEEYLVKGKGNIYHYAIYQTRSGIIAYKLHVVPWPITQRRENEPFTYHLIRTFIPFPYRYDYF